MQSMNSGEIDKPSNMSGAEEAETTYDGEVPLISAEAEERMAIDKSVNRRRNPKLTEREREERQLQELRNSIYYSMYN